LHQPHEQPAGSPSQWAGTTDDEWFAETEAGALDASECNGQRLEERAFLVADAVRKGMKPSFRMNVVAAKSAVDGRRGVEDDVWARIVAPGAAGFAGRLRAGNAAFESDSIT